MQRNEHNKKDMNLALIKAAKSGELEEVKELVKNGADIHFKDSFGNSAIGYAFINNNQACFEFLMQQGAKLDFDGMQNKILKTQEVITKGVKQNTQDIIDLTTGVEKIQQTLTSTIGIQKVQEKLIMELIDNLAKSRKEQKELKEQIKTLEEQIEPLKEKKEEDKNHVLRRRNSTIF